MLTPEKLMTFFNHNMIPLRGKLAWEKGDILALLWKASRHGYGLTTFISTCVVNKDRDGLETDFENPNTLYETYLCFMPKTGHEC